MWSDVIGAGFEPTSQKLVKKMLELAEVGPNDVVYDLGSGDGRIVVEAAKRYQARSVGIEADPVRFLYSKLMVYFIRQKVNIIWGNFFKHDISEATVVTLFLRQKTNEKLKIKLENELKTGTRVVTYVWTFKDWKPFKISSKDRIYLYIIGKQ